jgi:hypothetical protein
MASSLPSSIDKGLANQATKLLTKGDLGSTFDRIRCRKYHSSFLFPVGLGGIITSRVYPVFQTSLAQTGQGYATSLTRRETSWEQSGRLPDQVNILTRAFHVGIQNGPTVPGTTPPGQNPYATGTVFGVTPGAIDLNVPAHPRDVLNIASGIILRLKYLSTTYELGKLSDYPEPGGQFGWTQASRQVPDPAVNPGVAATPTATVDARGYLPVTRNACDAIMERRLGVPILLKHGDQFSMELWVPVDIPLMGPHPLAALSPNYNDASGCIEIVVSMWVVESYYENA